LIDRLFVVCLSERILRPVHSLVMPVTYVDLLRVSASSVIVYTVSVFCPIWWIWIIITWAEAKLRFWFCFWVGLFACVSTGLLMKLRTDFGRNFVKGLGMAQRGCD